MIDIQEETEIDEIIRQAAAVGVDYDSYWQKMCTQVKRIQSQCAPWRDEDFLYRIVGSKVYDVKTGNEVFGANIKAIQAADVAWYACLLNAQAWVMMCFEGASEWMIRLQGHV